jgi:hypothetical protein
MASIPPEGQKTTPTGPDGEPTSVPSTSSIGSRNGLEVVGGLMAKYRVENRAGAPGEALPSCDTRPDRCCRRCSRIAQCGISRG